MASETSDALVSTGRETTGDSPSEFQVTVTLPSAAAVISFRDWIQSAECQAMFWQWLSRNGRFI